MTCSTEPFTAVFAIHENDIILISKYICISIDCRGHDPRCHSCDSMYHHSYQIHLAIFFIVMILSGVEYLNASRRQSA